MALFCKPRLAGRQLNRENVPSDSVSEHYKKASVVHFLTICYRNLIRVLSNQVHCLLQQIFCRRMQVTDLQLRSVSKKFWTCTIPTSRNKLNNYRKECLRWKTRWDRVHDPPATIVETPPHCHTQKFPNLSRAFTTLLTLPIIAATVERSFSANLYTNDRLLLIEFTFPSQTYLQEGQAVEAV